MKTIRYVQKPLTDFEALVDDPTVGFAEYPSDGLEVQVDLLEMKVLSADGKPSKAPSVRKHGEAVLRTLDSALAVNHQPSHTVLGVLSESGHLFLHDCVYLGEVNTSYQYRKMALDKMFPRDTESYTVATPTFHPTDKKRLLETYRAGGNDAAKKLVAVNMHAEYHDTAIGGYLEALPATL